jgi:ABC-2 type transport system permease protein
MRGLAKLTTIEAKVLFLRDPVRLLVAQVVPIGSPAMLLVAHVVVNLAMAVLALALMLGIGVAWLGMTVPARAGWFAVAFLLGTAALFAVTPGGT